MDRPVKSTFRAKPSSTLPDRIVVNLGIETWDTDMAVAKQKNNDILAKAVAAIKELDVKEKEVQTDHLSIEPQYRNDDVRHTP